MISHKSGYFLVINKNFDREMFIINANVVTGTYAEEVVNRICNELFSELIDVYNEYQKYYSEEFSTMFKYLEKKFNLDTETIDEIKGFYKENMTIYYGKSNSTGDYILDNLLKSDQILDFLNNMLKDKTDENKS